MGPEEEGGRRVVIIYYMYYVLVVHIIILSSIYNLPTYLFYNYTWEQGSHHFVKMDNDLGGKTPLIYDLFLHYTSH